MSVRDLKKQAETMIRLDGLCQGNWLCSECFMKDPCYTIAQVNPKEDYRKRPRRDFKIGIAKRYLALMIFEEILR